MVLDALSMAITVVEQAWVAGVFIKEQIKHFRLNGGVAESLCARLDDIKRQLEGHREELSDETTCRAPVWEDALNAHQEDFNNAQTEIVSIKTKLEAGNMKKFLSSSSTGARLEKLLSAVSQLQRDLQQKGFFMAARDETKDFINFRVGAATEELKEFLVKLIGGTPGNNPAGDGSGLPALPAPPTLPGQKVSDAALYRGLGMALDGPVETGWKGLATRVAEGVKACSVENPKAGPGGAVEFESSPVSSRHSTAGSSSGPRGDGGVKHPLPFSGTTGNEEDDVVELEQLHERMTKFLFKLSESSLSDEEKKMTATLVESLWGMWQVDVGDIERTKDEEGQYMEIGDGSYGRVYKGTKALRDENGVVARDLPVAIKVLHKEQSRACDKMKFLREVLLLREAAHRNVISFYGAHWPDADVGGGSNLAGKAFLVTELVSSRHVRGLVLRERGICV